jgi:hypothetical protein
VVGYGHGLRAGCLGGLLQGILDVGVPSRLYVV